MKKDLKKDVLKKIEDQKVKVHSKNYFIFLRVLLYSVTAVLIFVGIYIFNIMLYLPHRAWSMGGRGPRLQNILTLFPWPLLLIGSLIVGLLVFLYRNYEGGYKRHLGVTAIIIFGLTLILGAILAGSNFNQRFERGPGMKRFYQWNEDNFVPRGPRDRLRLENIKPAE